MNDLISRQAAIDAIMSVKRTDNLKSVAMLIMDLPSAQPEPMTISIDHELTQEEYKKLCKGLTDAPIVLLPSAQPDIIRCKDCKWKNKHNCTRAVEVFVHDDCYCSWAERKDNG